MGGGRACAGHPHGLGLAAGTGWQGPYIQLVLQSCRDRKWARSRLASGVGRLYVRPVPLDRAEGVGIAKLPIGELINLSSPMGNLVAHIPNKEASFVGKTCSNHDDKIRNHLRNHSGRPPPLDCFGPSPCARCRSPQSPSSCCGVHRLQARGRRFVRKPCSTADRMGTQRR